MNKTLERIESLIYAAEQALNKYRAGYTEDCLYWVKSSEDWAMLARLSMERDLIIKEYEDQLSLDI